MASNRKYKWDRLSVEDDLDYSYFLVFRNLGPRRTLRAAYRHFASSFGNAQKTPLSGVNVPEKWKSLRRENRWVERASAWDVHCLKSVGCRVAVNQSQAILSLSREAVRTARKVRLDPEQPAELLDVMRTIQGYLTPDAVAAVALSAAPLADDPSPVAQPAESVE